MSATATRRGWSRSATTCFLGVVTQSMAEITVLAEKGGVSRAAFLDFLTTASWARCSPVTRPRRSCTSTTRPPSLPVLLRKDFDLGLAAARELDVPMPIAAATAQLVQATVSSGRTSEDFAVLLDQQAASSGMS
jgi:3-hydroxyisobutyrate dehydrogenase-like beta-hydroxyacid dehydrogenase